MRLSSFIAAAAAVAGVALPSAVPAAAAADTPYTLFGSAPNVDWSLSDGFRLQEHASFAFYITLTPAGEEGVVEL
jgi:hypothetical protein